MLTVQQVKSSEDLANGPSRWSKDKGDYTMDTRLFHYLLQKMTRAKVYPQVDMVASPGNHQLPNFVSRYPHWQAMEVDALKCPLEKNSMLLCKSTLVHNWEMAPQTKGKQTFGLSNDNSLLGFSLMVAPTNKTAGQGDP